MLHKNTVFSQRGENFDDQGFAVFADGSQQQSHSSAKYPEIIPLSTVGNAGLKKHQSGKVLQRYKPNGVLSVGKILIGDYDDDLYIFFSRKLEPIVSAVLVGDELARLIELHGFDISPTSSSLEKAAKRLGLNVIKAQEAQ